MMNIAVNTRLLIKNRLDGMGWFSYETLKRITTNHPEHRFYFLFDRPWDQEFIFSPNIVPVKLFPPARHPLLWYIWLEFSVHRFLSKNNIDLFVSPDGFIPLHSKVPCYSVVHDINFLHRPGDLPFLNRVYYNYFFPRFVLKANRVGTVSLYSANDISSSYVKDLSLIDVFHNGANAVYSPLSVEEIKKTRAKISNGWPYFVFVGTLHPRKNVANLLRAYERFRQEGGIEVKMLIVGEKYFMTRDIVRTLNRMKFQEDVLFTGRLGAEDLHKVVASSLAMTFIPYFEGFGIPMLEAMRCGIPVIASYVTSLPEVGGEAALYCNPDDIEQVAKSMWQLAEDEDLRNGLIRKGLERSKLYSWDQTAQKLWAGIEKVLYGT
jgi:glycosyltransferase involved in cell wall biosynthesis